MPDVEKSNQHASPFLIPDTMLIKGAKPINTKRP